MTIHQFPAHRIVRTESERGQGITPLALFFLPARLWISYWSRWMDIAIEAEPETNVTLHFGRVDRR